MQGFKIMYRHWEDSIIAIFPEEIADANPDHCMSYQHLGQHGSCNPIAIIQESRQAEPAEYLDLHAELMEIYQGFHLQVIQEYPQNAQQIRQMALNSINQLTVKP